MVPWGYKTDSGYKLYTWVSTQRTLRPQLLDERRNKLEALPKWSWNVIEDKWDKGFNYLSQYAKKNSNCFVPPRFLTSDGYPLGKWVNFQRTSKDKIPEERKIKLEALSGWSLNALKDKWEIGFINLEKFVVNFGHCKVPRGFKSNDGFNLGSWTSHQIRNKTSLPISKINRLEGISDWSWNKLDDKWEIGFNYLKAYVKDHGNCFMPDLYVLESGFRLNQWVKSQRAKGSGLSLDKRRKLESLKGWSWNPLDERWNQAFNYFNKNGLSSDTTSYKLADGSSLNQWINIQRRNKDKLSLDKRKRLESLKGWSWNPLDERWEIGFKSLNEYLLEHGHCMVPARTIVKNKYPLGQWVSVQRRTKDILTKERKKRLESLKGWSWDARIK